VKVHFILNGKRHSAKTPPGETLLEHLRKSGFYSVKHGCDEGSCGACTVLIDGRAQNACLILVQTLAGKTVETLEHFNLKQGVTPLQEAFLKTGAIQCGYCTPAMLLALEAVKRTHPKPDIETIREALSGVLCRCTGYVKPVAAAMHENVTEGEEQTGD